MKIDRVIKGLLIAGGLAFGGSALAVTPSASMLGNTCAGCHGSNGSSNGPATPSLAGVSEDYFIETMEGYKEGEINATIMNRIAKGYTDEEIELMAAFFAKQTFQTINQKTDSKMVSKGKRLHKKYCEKCHEDGGTSSEDDTGILAGQMMPYLDNTMHDFMNGDREMSRKMSKKMKLMHKKSGNKGIQELIHYYGSQR